MPKAVKEKATKSAEKGKKSTEGKEPGVKLNGASRMKVLKSTANPHREGTKAHAWFEQLRPLSRVQEALDANVNRGYIKLWISKGLVKIG